MSWIVISETVRRNVGNIYYVLIAIFAGLMTFLSTYGDHRASGPGPAFMALLLGAQLFGPEQSAGTLQLAFSRPIRRATYAVSRIAGVSIAALILITFCVIVDVVTAVSIGASIVLEEYLLNLARAVLGIIFFIALLGLFGSFTRSYANLLLFLVYFGAVGGISDALSDKFPTLSDLATKNLFPRISTYTPEDYLRVVSNILILILLTCVVLRRRQLSYGSD